METTYRTAQVAELIGVHPNTVRLYEELELIPKPIRLPNGYRVFTEFHVEQFRLARTAFQVEVLQNGLRKKMISIIKLSAKSEFQNAIELTKSYIRQVRTEQRNAEEAIRMAEQLLANTPMDDSGRTMTRQEVSNELSITMDTLRNWEMNGLLDVKRKQNGYRIYTQSDIKKLKIIRSLRCANYSLSAILRMMHALNDNKIIDIRNTINTPETDETIVSVCDKLLTSLSAAEENATYMLKQLKLMKRIYQN